MSTLDPETTKQLTEAEAVILMTESAGWKIVKPKLDQLILDLQNMSNLDRTKPLEAQVDGRLAAAEILFVWMKNDVYGFIEQQQVNSDALRDSSNESHIDRAL